MIKDRLTLIIHSCQKFSDLWDVHFKLLEENWPDRDIETILVTDTNVENKSYDGVKIITAGEGKEITERITAVLPEIKTEYILVTLDDYLDIYPISTERIEKLVDILEKDELDYICIYHRPRPAKKYKEYPNLYQVDLSREYRVNLYPGLWRKSFMEKTIGEPMNAWEYEVSLTRIANKINAKCIQSKGEEFKIMDTVRKGKILRKADKYLKSRNLYHGNRPIRKRREEILQFIIVWSMRALPKEFTKFLKRLLRIKTYRGY